MSYIKSRSRRCTTEVKCICGQWASCRSSHEAEHGYINTHTHVLLLFIKQNQELKSLLQVFMYGTLNYWRDAQQVSAGAQWSTAYQCVPRLAWRQEWFTWMGPFRDTLQPSQKSELIIAMCVCWRAIFFFHTTDWMEMVLWKVVLKSHHDLCSLWKSNKFQNCIVNILPGRKTWIKIWGIWHIC